MPGARRLSLGLGDHPADELAGRDELVDRADALAGGEELAGDVDGGAVGRAEVVDAGRGRRDHLGGERLQLVGVLLEVLRPLVAHDAAGLAGVGAADHRAVLGGGRAASPCSRRPPGPRGWR